MTRKRRNPEAHINDDDEPVAHRTRSRLAAARRNNPTQMPAAVDSPAPQSPAPPNPVLDGIGNDFDDEEPEGQGMDAVLNVSRSPTQVQQVALAQGGVSGATGSSKIKLVRGVAIVKTDQGTKKKEKNTDKGNKKTETTIGFDIVCTVTPQAKSLLLVMRDESMSVGMAFGAKLAYAAYKLRFRPAPHLTSIRYSAKMTLSGTSGILGTAVCLGAAYEDFEVPQDLIITGAVDEAGTVQKISGTLLKARHAIDRKCRLMLPVDNLRDLPKKMKKSHGSVSCEHFA
eukprot:NP_494169.3 F-box B protein [Caenorhabditis elegans]